MRKGRTRREDRISRKQKVVLDDEELKRKGWTSTVLNIQWDTGKRKVSIAMSSVGMVLERPTCEYLHQIKVMLPLEHHSPCDYIIRALLRPSRIASEMK